MWSTTDNRINELREIEAAGGPMADDARKQQRVLAARRWTLEKQLLTRITDSEFLVKLLRPEMPGVPATGTLLTPDFVRLLPTAVAKDALRRARSDETHPGAKPFMDAVDAEVAWRGGQLESALALAQQSVPALPPLRRSVRARAALVAADCLSQLNRTGEALPLYDQALSTAPYLLRMLNVSLPVVVGEDGTPLASEMARRVLASPRFRGDVQGFKLLLRTEGDQLTFELFRANSIRHCQGAVSTAYAEDVVVSDAIHRLIGRMMSPVLDLTTTEINSLGSGLFSTPSTTRTDRLLKLAKPK
jgi:hypothetical protein